ncbi:MAG: hypothetical protein K2V38_01830 [Gemmataceae bacterium]|nr:hypothetical protein [Gemmataceae bacterium]
MSLDDILGLGLPETAAAVETGRGLGQIFAAHPWGLRYFEDDLGVKWELVPPDVLSRFTPAQLARVKQFRLGMECPLGGDGEFEWLPGFTDELEACGATGHYSDVPPVWRTGGYD